MFEFNLVESDWILMAILVGCILFIIIFVYSKYRFDKKERIELEKKIEEGDRERHEFRKFIKTVFNPIEAVHDYLHEKTVYLSQTEYFIYDKENPKYKVSLRNDGLMGFYNSKNDIYYLVCEIDDKEVVVQDIK